MAIKGGEIKYSVSFDVNTSQLTKAFDKIRDLSIADLKKISPQIDDKQLNAELNKIRATVNTLESAFTKAFNPKLNTVNIKTFKNELAGSNTNLQQVYNTLKQTGEVGENAFRQLSTKMLDTNIKLKETSGLFKEMGTTLKNSIKWNIASSVINTFSGKVQEAYGYVKNLDSSLNDIRIVTGKSADEMDRFAEKVNKAAKELGKSTTDYTKASLIYYQQGLSDEESAARTDVTLKAANVTQQSTQEVSEQLTAVWNGYKVSAEEAELYVDKLAAVAAGTASDLEELSTGMSKVASAANALGVDVDQMNAILSTSISVTRQAPETIGSAYKTIFARMSTISAGGTDEEDGATLTSYTDKMNKLGINVLDANNQLRDMGDVIEEVGGKWDSFSKEQQIALAQVMAGTRQYNNLIALFDNWDKYTAALNMSANAAGTLNEQQDIYMQSTQAHLQQLSTATEGVFDSLLGGEDINKVVDAIIPIVEGVESVIDAIGGGAGVLQLFGPMLLRSFSPEIAQQILTIHHNLQAVASNKQALENLRETINTFTNVQGVEGATQELMEYERQLGEFANFMSPEEFEEQKKKIVELSKAYEEYGAKRLAVDKKLSQLSETLGLDEKDITRDNYNEVAEKQSKDLIKKLKSEQETVSAVGQHQVFKLSEDGSIEEFEEDSKRAIEELQALKNSVTELSKIPGFENLQQQFDALSNSIDEEGFSDRVTEFAVTVDKEIDNIVGNLDNSTAEITGDLEKLINIENTAQQNTEEISQSVQDGFSDERLKAFTEGTVELTTSLFQVGSAAVNLAQNLHNIWNNDDLTNAEKFAQTLQLIAMNAGVMGNGLSSAKKAIDKLGSTYRASVKDQAANAIASTAQAKANEKVEKTAKKAGDAVEDTSEKDLKEAATSKIAEEANEGQSNAYKNQAGAPGLGTNIKDAAKGGLKAAKTGISKIGEIGKLGAGASGPLSGIIGKLGAFGAGIATLTAFAAAIAAVTIAIKLSYDAFTETQRAVENAQEAYDNSTASLKATTEEVNSLNSAIDQIDQEKATLNELVVGTTEWKEQLDKVNESVANLLEQFPELKQYATFKDGGWQIEEGKLEEFQNKLKQEQAQAQNMVYANEIDLAAAKRDKVAHTAQLEATDMGSTIGGTAAGYAASGALVGMFGGPIAAAIGAAIGGVTGTIVGTVQGFQKQKDMVENIEYDKNRGSAQDTQALLEKYQNATDETIKAELKQEIANTFSGLNEYSSDDEIEEYLSNLVTLQEAQNELDKIQVENSKAMLDANFGDNITKALTDKGYDEREQQVIKNAVERRAAQDSITRGQTIRNTLLDDNGNIANKDMEAEFQKFIQKSLAQQYGVDASAFEMTEKDGNTFKLKSDNEDINGQKFDYKEFLEDFIAYQTTSDEKAAQRIDSWMNSFESSRDGAYMTALADEVISGNVDTSTLLQSEIDTLEDMAELGIGGLNTESLKKILEEYDKNEAAIRNSVTSESGIKAYDTVLSLQGAEDLTQDQKKLIADKINQIYNEQGKKGVEEFIRQIEGTNVQVALSFDTEDAKIGLTKATQEALEEAKIDQSIFKNYKENYEAAGKHYSDTQIINYIKAEDDLNKIYEDRKTIFKSLEKAKIGSLDQEQLKYVNQLETAFEELTGLDFSTQDIIENYNIFQGYIEGTEEGIKNFKDFIRNLKAEDFDLKKIFENDDSTQGSAAPKIITDKIDQIATELELSQEQIDAIYASYGYFFNTETQQYEKNDNFKNLLSVRAVPNEYNKGDTASYGELLQTLGVSNREELKELGWTCIKRESGQEIWQKTSELTEYSKYRTVALDESGNTMEKFADSVGGMPSSALEKLGWKYRTIPSPGWYKVVDMTTVVNKKVEEGESDIPDFSPSPDKDDDKKLKAVSSPTKDIKTNKKEASHKYDVNYDVYDNVIKAKQQELKRLQDAEANLSGGDLTDNLKEQKKLYEEILEKQKAKNKLAKEDIENQKKNLDNLLSAQGLSIAQYDEDGNISNIDQIFKSAEGKKNYQATAYNSKLEEYNEKLKDYKIKAEEYNKDVEAGTATKQDETDIQKQKDELEKTESALKDLEEAYKDSEDELKALEEAYGNYTNALETSRDVIDDIIETQNNIDDTRIASYLTETNIEFERLSKEADNFASAMSDAVAQFQKLSGDEQLDALRDWTDLANTLKEVYSLQKNTLKTDLNNIINMGNDEESGIAKSNDEWKIIEERLKLIRDSEDELLDITNYLDILSRIENQITAAQSHLDDVKKNKDSTDDDIKKATAQVNTFKAIKTEIEESAKAAQALAKNLDDIYLTAGEVKDQFVDWQVSAIDTQIGLIDKKISRLQKQAGKLKGQALIDNLKKQNQEIEKQIKLEKGKLKILQAQMKLKKMMLQQSLSELAAALGTELSLSFDHLGNITAESIEQMEKAVVTSLKAAGAMGAAAQQQWNALLQMMEAYNAAAAAVQASMDAIEGYGDSMKDNTDAMKDALEEARNLALEIFNAKVDVEINIEDAWRQFDALQAKMNGIKDTDFLEQAELSAKNIKRYLGDISNPNSYFGSGKGSIGILTDHLNDIMSEINIMQSGGSSQYYGNDEGAAFDDLMNYANQLMSQVEAYYQELENVRQQYSNVIDAIISKNQELLDDYDKMNQLSKHGINITKLLYGEESYDKLSQYYTNVSKNTKAMLNQAVQSREYYAKEMKRLSDQGDTDSEAYQKMREGYEESMQQVYEYGEQLLEQYSEELMNKVNSYNQKMIDTLANLAGFADKLLMDQDWEHQTKLMDDYLDATNAAYEMQALQAKFQSSINDTDSLSGKRELTKVMNEQLEILEKQLEDGQMLTQYDIDRANKVYELTLKQIALEEAQQNKSKMRLRRDSQGNYRYEFVADQQKVEDARQDLLKAQNDLYNLDKNRTVEMINEIQTLQTDYYAKREAILRDSYLSEEEKKQALADLEMKYYGQPDGLIYMAVQEYSEAKKNMESSTDKEITFYHNTMAEAMAQNWNDIAAAESANTQQILSDLDEQAAKVQEATDLMSQGYDSLDDAIKANIASMEELLHLDEELLDKYAEEMVAIEGLMKELEKLEDQYRAVLDAAMAAIEAALRLRQIKWDDDDDDDDDTSSSDSSDSSGGSSSGGGGGGGGSSIKSNTATIEYEIRETDGKHDARILGSYPSEDLKKIRKRVNTKKYRLGGSVTGATSAFTVSFDTGGYTGAWGKEGKVAMLHEKELILNKADTRNILDTVNIVRQLGTNLSAMKDIFGAKMTKYSDTMSNNINGTTIDNTSSQKLDQNVKIEANFPNVKSANEIETAFNNLVNLASQRAMSTRR